MAKDELQPRDGVIMPTWHQAQGEGVTVAGQAIIAANADFINAYVKGQRENVRNSGLDQHRHQVQSPDLDIEYHYHFGEEHIRLTPYPVRPEHEEPEVVFLNPVFPPIETPDFPPPEPNPTLCMLVLYKGNKYAAIPMAQLYAGNPNFPQFGAVYTTTDDHASFTAPVLVGQYNLAGFNFIITDVDLSGKKLKGSTICTTRLLDGISLGRKTIPIANSEQGVGGRPSIDNTITIFTSPAAVSYQRGKFTIVATNTNTQQAQAITKDGTLYYGGQLDSSDLCSLHVSDTDTDSDTRMKTVDAEQVKVSNFVPFYDLNYVIYYDINYKETEERKNDIQLFPTHQGNGQYGTVYAVNVFSARSEQKQTSRGYLTVISTVVPSDPGLGPQYVNLNNITDVIGVSFYGKSTYGQAMTVENVKFSTVDAPYFEWVQADLLYEYMLPTGRQVDYSNDLQRMAFDTDGSISMTTDRVSASGVGTNRADLKYTQHYPGWGGDMFGGVTVNTLPEIPFDYTESDAERQGPEFLPYHIHDTAFRGTEIKQIVGHATLDSTIPNLNATYEQGLQMAQELIGKMTTPTPGGNGGPGPISNYSSTDTFDNYSTYTQVLVDYGNGHYGAENKKPTPYDGDSTSSSSGPIAPSPGYLGQIIATKYDLSISWNGNTVTGHVDDDGGATIEGEIIVSLWPPGTSDIGYGVVAQNNSTGFQSTKVVTPYKSFTVSSIAAADFKGWMHVSDPNYVMQGFIIEKKPYIYLNGTDITSALAKALNCEPKDIAACYFDIDLDAIKLLAGVT